MGCLLAIHYTDIIILCIISTMYERGRSQAKCDCIIIDTECYFIQCHELYLQNYVMKLFNVNINVVIIIIMSSGDQFMIQVIPL